MVLKVHGKKLRRYKDPLRNAKNKSNGDMNCAPKNHQEQEGKMFFQNSTVKSYINNEPKTSKPKNSNKKSKRLDTADFVPKLYGSAPKSIKLKAIPTIKQNRKESDDHFLKRVTALSGSVIKESMYEDKHQTVMQRDKNGNITKSKSFDSVDAEAGNRKVQKKLELKNLKKKEKNKAKYLKAKLKKHSKMLNKLKHTDSDLEEEMQEKEHPKKKIFIEENIEFGETNDQPPALDDVLMDKKFKELNKMKCANFLFLQNLRKTVADKEPEEEAPPPKESAKELLAKERDRLIFAYRQMKNKNNPFLL